MSDQRFLGVVEVDSGTLVVGDPLYFLPAVGERAGVDYAAVVAADDVPAQQLAGQPALLLGRFGGDGSFPVFGEFDEDGLLIRASILFVEPEE